MPMVLSTVAVANVTGATVRMIDHWARTGLIRPSGQDATGKGSRRRYTFQDIIVVRAILTLREGNCPLQKIRTAIRFLQTNYPTTPVSQVLAKLTLLTDGQKVYLLTDERQLMEVVTRQLHITWAVPLGRIIIEMGQRLEAMPTSWVEPVQVNKVLFRIMVSRRHAGAPFVARCRELPGAVAEAPTADTAVAKLRVSIALVLAHEPSVRSRRRQSRVGAAS